jgi:hypothetical protein
MFLLTSELNSMVCAELIQLSACECCESHMCYVICGQETRDDWMWSEVTLRWDYDCRKHMKHVDQARDMFS